MPEPATGGVLLKKSIFKNLQNLQENTCARVSFSIKLQARGNFFYRATRANYFWNVDIAKTKQEK